jgi:choice-of-anchor C domain-containing protein
MYHTATLLADGSVLVVGPSVIPGNLVNAEIYTPATGTWAATGNYNTNRYGHTVTLLANARVLMAGGTNGGPPPMSSSAEIYTPARGTWIYTSNMATGRIEHTATRLPDGRVLVAGGVDLSTLSNAEFYDPALGTWSAADALTYSHQNHTATLLLDGRVLVAGGFSSSSELFDPQNYIKNGSFESWSMDYVGTTNTIYSWSVHGLGIVREDWQPAEGRFSLDLNKATPGNIEQRIDTVPGKKYLVTFALAGNPEGGPAVKTLRVSAGTQFHDFSFDITGKSIYNIGWTKKSWTFSAEGVLTSLLFQSLTSGGYGPALDNVRVIQDTQLSHLPPLLLLLN